MELEQRLSPAALIWAIELAMEFIGHDIADLEPVEARRAALDEVPAAWLPEVRAHVARFYKRRKAVEARP